ncbi:MAG: hypothetical protein RI911_728 [Candidatus Parcubacteria bacterium]|jgi:prepilin-type N-terminal cleavage/methylation domain-containing protein
MKRAESSRGFTIVELLVVVAIITMLIGVLMYAFTDPKKNSRDAKRMSDIRDLAQALELYSIQSQAYPAAAALTTLSGTDPVSATLTSSGVLKKPVIDPLMPTYEYRYQTNSGGSTYNIQFCLETDRIHGYAIGCGNVYTP